jgi:hypothetical protein
MTPEERQVVDARETEAVRRNAEHLRRLLEVLNARRAKAIEVERKGNSDQPRLAEQTPPPAIGTADALTGCVGNPAPAQRCAPSK